MTGLRDARAAVLTRWHRDLGDNFTAVLPRVLDDLEAADRAHVPGGIEPAAEMSEQELAELRARWRAIWEREQAEMSAVEAGEVPHPDAPSLAAQVAQAKAPAAPAPPARARKPRGGTTT